MELSELNVDERVALVGLVKTVLLADRRVSAQELEEIRDVADAIGQPSYEAALDTFDKRFPDEPSFRRFLETIDRQEARELIFGTILQGASIDAIEGRESELLSWLEKAWDVEVKVEEPLDGGDSGGSGG